jgi:Transcriptional regulators
MAEKLIKMRPLLHREVAELISERIISGELAEKSLLPAERELCETMGVSRTVIREAMKLLESRGLVRIDRGRGTVVQEAHMGPLGDSLKLLLRPPPSSHRRPAGGAESTGSGHGRAGGIAP